MAYKPIKTPRGKIEVVNVKVGTSTQLTATLTWNPGFEPKINEQFENVQKFVESEVIRLCEPYTPFLTGMLVKSGTLGTKLGEGVIRWIAPYARYQYYGKLMVGRAPKTLTNIDLKYHGGGRRGAFWFERMKENHMDEIVAGAQTFINRGGKV